MALARSIGATTAVAALALIATALPTYAGEAAAPSATESITALSSQGELKAKTIAPDARALAISNDASAAVVLNPQSEDTFSIGLPEATERQDGVTRDGLTVYQGESDQTSVVVNPTTDGVQLATVIGATSSPTSYTYPINGPARSEVILDDEGGASILDQDGNPLAGIDAPWAQDANGKRVPTRFVLSGPNELTQIVDHTGGDFAYPVTADPKVFRCDAYTSTCVKFSKKETKAISSKIVGRTAYATAIAICTRIPSGAIGVACVAVVTPYALAMGKSFKSAAKKGKCVEVHFVGLGFVPYRWKTEKC